jgi:hypothetical protein
MSPKKKRTFNESAERWFRLFVIFMAKDMTLKNPWALFLAPTAGGILTWMLVPAAFHYAFYDVPIISDSLQRTFYPAATTHLVAAYILCIYLTYVLLKPLCRGLVVCHPDYFNEGNLR